MSRHVREASCGRIECSADEKLRQTMRIDVREASGTMIDPAINQEMLQHHWYMLSLLAKNVRNRINVWTYTLHYLLFKKIHHSVNELDVLQHVPMYRCIHQWPACDPCMLRIDAIRIKVDIAITRWNDASVSPQSM
jgi:hypothetical protein